MYPTLGAGSDAPQRCRDAGGFYTVFPYGYAKAGQPACRTRNADGSLAYADALNLPERIEAKVADWWNDAGDAAVNAANTADEAARALLSAPRDAASIALGVPPWVVTVALLAVGFVVLSHYAGKAALDLKEARRG
jgi:hypothetical protein